jgi:PAS domain S-box-containing protein
MFGELLSFCYEAVWIHHIKSHKTYSYISPDTSKKYGVPNDVTLDFLRSKVHHNDVEKFTASYLAAIENPGVELFERKFRFSDRSGFYHFIWEKNKIARNNEGAAIFMISIWQDVSKESVVFEGELERQREENANDGMSRKNEIKLVRDELKQINDQLVANLNTLTNQELILSQSHKIANMASWEYNLEEKKIFLSDNFYSIHGLSKKMFDDADMNSYLQLYGESQFEVLKRALSQIIEGGHAMDVTVRAVTPLGYKKWIRVVAFGVYDKERLLKIDGIAQDVTTSRERELRLRASEEKFSKAFHNDPDVKIIIDVSDLLIVDANRRAQQIIGYGRHELVGKFFPDFSFFLTQEEEQKFFDDYSFHGSTDLETTWRTRAGTHVRVSITGSSFEHGDGRYYIAVIKDISYRKMAEEKLLISEANLKATINNTNILVWSVDRDFRLVMFNEPFRQYIKAAFGLEVFPSLEIPETMGTDGFKNKWTERYKRALSGETFKLTEYLNDLVLAFSLNPIIDNGIVIGVSVFGEDVTERMLQAKKLNEANRMVAEFKLMAMRSVMNPHFIYNALNSIQSFIAKNDRLNAIGYLSKFAKLIRGIVTNSISNKIKLSEELDLLTHYIHLEQIRFQKQFDFAIIIEPGLDSEAIEIPSLLIQPYVENAIVHGLYNKTSQGKLNISVWKKAQGVLFEIQDNGIGRTAAQKFKEEAFPDHKSMGTRLTEERLKLINEIDNVSVIIEDLHNDNEPAGTLVKIWVKV